MAHVADQIQQFFMMKLAYRVKFRLNSSFPYNFKHQWKQTVYPTTIRNQKQCVYRITMKFLE